MAVVGAVGLVAVVGGLVHALRSEVLDPRAVERDIAAQFQQGQGVAVELDCSDGMKVVAGATYRCTGATADGEPVQVQITVTDEKTASYTWTEP